MADPFLLHRTAFPCLLPWRDSPSPLNLYAAAWWHTDQLRSRKEKSIPGRTAYFVLRRPIRNTQYGTVYVSRVPYYRPYIERHNYTISFSMPGFGQANLLHHMTYAMLPQTWSFVVQVQGRRFLCRLNSAILRWVMHG